MTTPDASPAPVASKGLKNVVAADSSERYVRHRGFLGELTAVSSELDKKDATFVARPGLAGPGPRARHGAGLFCAADLDRGR